MPVPEVLKSWDMIVMLVALLLASLFCVIDMVAKALGFRSIFCLFERKPRPDPVLGSVWRVKIHPEGHDISECDIRAVVLGFSDVPPTALEEVLSTHKSRWPRRWYKVQMTSMFGRAPTGDSEPQWVQNSDFHDRYEEVK